MKEFLFITLFSLCLFACGNNAETSNASADTASTEPSAAEMAKNIADNAAIKNVEAAKPEIGKVDISGSDETPTHVKSSPLSPYIGIWKYSFSTYEPEYYKNRWIEFKVDGTFENGVGGKKTNQGKWVLDVPNKLLNLDFENNEVERDEQWLTQMNNPVLLLLGNSPLNNTGGQIKMDKIDARPAK